MGLAPTAGSLQPCPPLPISVGGLALGALARWRREAVAGRFGQLCVVDHTTAARTSWRQPSWGVAGSSGGGIRICTTTATGERSRGDTTLVNCGRDSSRARLLADNRCLYICSSTEVKIGKDDGRKRMLESMRVRMVMSIIGHPSYASHTKAKTWRLATTLGLGLRTEGCAREHVGDVALAQGAPHSPGVFVSKALPPRYAPYYLLDGYPSRSHGRH